MWGISGWDGYSSWWTTWRLPLVFALLWSTYEWSNTRPLDSANDEHITQPPSQVLTEAVKLILSIVYFLWQRTSVIQRGRVQSRKLVRLEDGIPLNGLGPEDDGGRHHRRSISRDKPIALGSRVPRTFAGALTVLAAVLFISATRNAQYVEYLLDKLSSFLFATFATLAIAIFAYIFAARTHSLSQWQSILLQLCGFGIVQTNIIALAVPTTILPFAATSILTFALFLVCMEFIYTRVTTIPPAPLHIIFFACTFLLSAVSSPPDYSIYNVSSRLTSQAVFNSTLKASQDLVMLAIVYYHGSTTTSVVLSGSMALYLAALALHAGSYTFGLLSGCSATLIGTVAFILSSTGDGGGYPRGNPHWALRSLAMLALGIISSWLAFTTPDVQLQANPATQNKSILTAILAAQNTCHRRPLPLQVSQPRNLKYHAFDNILLIVFFSHARYDVNMDYYRETYSEYFPNIVFVGPGNREDQGFRHSYDVLVDTYQSDEDLSDPDFYKMAGRMAHHMLYTAMREYDCYDGYLWAPFDALLNVPRLQQFDQRYFWYHSPFGQYVHNPALGSERDNSNSSRHAPPANISPDPALNLSATWKHWGPDWWWGEPHVGVDVCMPAFLKTPLPMRQHLASLTNGTRFIGGSADTLYIPGRHRQVFMDNLGLFLETNCFLEIATPTALHLSAPPGEPILFVDHWWIWQPPLNASFVRQTWRKGMEVDTFHTFHWGDKGDDDVWRGNRDHIEDVRELLKESAVRQGVEWPFE